MLFSRAGAIGATVLACACLTFVPGPSRAEPTPTSSASASPSSSGEEFSRVDIITLMATVLEELKQYSGKILVETKPAAAMPSYDPLVYYAGIGADRRQPFKPVVWTIGDATTKGYAHALFRAYVMAVMDAGEAGPKFKRAYDVAAGEDQALPGSAPDPYQHRHKLAEPFVSELTNFSKTSVI